MTASGLAEPPLSKRPAASTRYSMADEIAILRAMPRFSEAARLAATGLVESYRGHFILNRLLNDRGRIVLSLLMLGLYFEGQDSEGRDDPTAGGLTSGRLKAQAAELNVCSAGRATAVLAAFRLIGLVVPVPDADRRLRRLAVAPALLDIHRDRWQRLLAPMALLMPEGADGLAGLDDPAFVRRFTAALLEPFKRGWRMLDDVPALAAFADRDAGIVIALSLLETDGGQQGRPIAHLARQFHVSRAHVLGILQAGEQAGLLSRLDPRAGARAEPALVEALESLLATTFVMQARAVRAATKVGEAVN